MMKEELLTIRDHIVYLRRWLQQQQPILNSLDTDEFLLRFLRVTDFRLENTKQWIINFWRYRAENPQWFVILIIIILSHSFVLLRFQNRDLLQNSLMRQIAQLAYCLQLPKTTKEKHHILLIRMGQYDPSMYTIDDVTRYAFAVMDIINSQPTIQLYGCILLFDFTNIRLVHLSQFTPDRLRRYIDCWKELYPVHLRQIHFYNYPSIFHPFLSLFRSIYRRELNDQIYLHPRTSDDTMKKSLHVFLDPELLPNEYGGQLGSLETDINQTFVQWIEERNQSLVQLEQYGTDVKQLSQLLRKQKKKGTK